MSMIKSIVNQMVRQTVKSVTGATKRYQILLDSTTSSYYAIDAITMEDDFSVSGDVYVTVLDGVIIGGPDLEHFCYIQANGKAIIRVANSTSSESSLTVSINEFHSFVMARTGTTVTLHIDGVEFISYTKAGDFIVSLSGASSSGNFLDGIISNLLVNNVTAGEQYLFTLGNPIHNTEISNGKTATYTNIASTQAYREQYQLSIDETQWNNISPPTQQLPAILVIA